MATIMNPCAQLLLLSCILLTARPGWGSAGPVFVNPSVAVASSAPPSPSTQGSLVTQTVYGFLDFTTTIGNTVMVFSPQSAAPAPDGGKDKATLPTVNAVIDSKPVTPNKPEPSLTIKPSKTQSKVEKKSSESPKKVSSVVSVLAQSPAGVTSKVEIKSEPLSKVNIVQSTPSIVNVVNAIPSMSSKVEIVAAPVSKIPEKNIITKVEVVAGSSSVKSQPVVSSRVEVREDASSTIVTPPPVMSSIVEVHSKDDEPAVIIGNNIGEPEYDFLSRQPSEFVEETYKVINLKPSSKFHLKPRASADPKNRQNQATKKVDALHPTGLVTKLGGTVVKDGTTTVHETSVIGTYISGKYAQVLQSTSRVHNNQKGKINPSPTLRILKTAAPAIGKQNKQHHLEPTPAGSVGEETALPVENLFNDQNSIRPTRKPTAPGGTFKPRFKNRSREQEAEEENDTREVTSLAKKKNKLRTTQAPRTNNEEVTSSAAFAPGRKYQTRRNKQQRPPPTTAAPEAGSYTRRGYKPRIQASTVEQTSATTTSVYKFKLNRSPGRWQYKTTPKPRVTIRKQNDNDPINLTTPSLQDSLNDVVTPQSRSDEVDGLVGSESVASIIDDESSTENKIDNAFPLETIKVEISTPPDFKNTYFEIATIKSPYTFQVGSVKNTRYITVTSTFEKLFESSTTEAPISPTRAEPLTENILATSNNYDKDNNFLDSSIATLPLLYMASDMETPPLETLTETFSTTQTMLKTHILPAVRGINDTSSFTLVQTYHITRLVTATKTLPPMEAYHFVPSKILNEFNSHLDEAGSELNLELAFGDENDNDDENRPRRVFPPDLDLANVGSDFDLSDVDKSRIPEGHLRTKKAHPSTTPKPQINEVIPTPGLSPEQLQQLALLRLLNPAAAPPQGQVITTSKPVFTVETVYESHIIPIFNGQSTVLTTISKALGTVTKTDYELATSTLPGLQIPPVNPLFPQAQPQFAVTTSPVVQTTVVTETSSKILKLTFGAKTAYTTIFSTKIIPTLLTTYMTASVPVQPTAAFPGFFQAGYPPFPYVG